MRMGKSKQAYGLHLRVVIPILLLVIIIGAVSYETYMTRKLTVRRMEDSLHIQASNQAELLYEKINSKFSVLDGFGNVMTKEDIQNKNDLLSRMTQCVSKTDFISLNFAYPDGTAFRNDGKEMDLSDRWYFQECLKGNKAIEYLENGKLVENVRIGIAVPVVIEGTIEGVLIGDYDDKLFQDLWETIELNVSDYVFVCDYNGKVIARTETAGKELDCCGNVSEVFPQIEFSSNSQDSIKQDMLAGRNGEASYWYKGQMRYAMYEPVGISGWYIVTVMPESQIYEEAMKEATVSYIMLGAVILAVVGVILFIVMRERRQILLAREKARELRYTLEHDELTGILVEKAFMEQMAKRLETVKPEEYCLVYLDIYKFKLINEMFGYDKADELLKAMAEELSKLAENKDGLCGRISADKFIVFLPNQQDIINEFYTKKLRKKRIIPSEIYLHYGIYIIRDTKKPIAQMIDCAQLAQKEVKGNYDNCVNFYDEKLKQKILREQEIINTMAKALEEREFVTYLQPQYDYKTGAITGAEALVRWISSTKGFVSPGDFIPIFETNGFIIKLDEYVWEEACRQIRDWIDRGYPPVPISINVSRVDLLEGAVADKLVGLIEKYNLTSDLLRVEITESAYIDNPQKLIMEITRLRDEGFVIEMDDFGSGYSSLNILKDVPISVLKTDLKFLTDTGVSNSKYKILEVITQMAYHMGLKVIAEGVETKEQADYLQSIGCRMMQGYYFSKPVPIWEFEQLAYHNEL